MKKIKWENIAFILFIAYSIAAIMHHTFNSLSILEIPVYLMLAIILRCTIKSIRKGE
jgi:hypothetical protein